MNDVSKLSLGEFAEDLKTRLSDQITTCSQHLDNKGIKEGEAIAESFSYNIDEELNKLLEEGK